MADDPTFHIVNEFLYVPLVSKIRLAGSNMTYAGRIEVNIAGVWGTIRNRGWNITSAHVACKELGYPGAETAILFATATFGQGEGPVWMSNLNCQGHESTLWECSWSRIAGIYWDHYNDAGVICRVEDPSEYKLGLHFALLALGSQSFMSLLPRGTLGVAVKWFFILFCHRPLLNIVLKTSLTTPVQFAVSFPPPLICSTF